MKPHKSLPWGPALAELGFEPLSGDPGSAPFDPLHQGPANFFHKGPGSKSVLGSVDRAVSVAQPQASAAVPEQLWTRPRPVGVAVCHTTLFVDVDI